MSEVVWLTLLQGVSFVLMMLLAVALLLKFPVAQPVTTRVSKNVRGAVFVFWAAMLNAACASLALAVNQPWLSHLAFTMTVLFGILTVIRLKPSRY